MGRNVRICSVFCLVAYLRQMLLPMRRGRKTALRAFWGALDGFVKTAVIPRGQLTGMRRISDPLRSEIEARETR